MVSSVQKMLLERQQINETIRSFFRSRGYVEVETPIVVRSPGMESNLDPFETTLLDERGNIYPAGIITSPEYAMKKLLGFGMERIFTLTHVLRNREPMDATHNAEFTMLEWYQQGVEYQFGMDETEALVRAVGKVFGKEFPSFARLRIRDLVWKYGRVDLDEAGEPELREACRKNAIHDDPSDTESDLFYRLFLHFVEPEVAQGPAFVYDYPLSQAALSSKTPDGKYGQRFELYLDGLELCNGFTELTDAGEQRRRFLEEAQERVGNGKRVFPVDEAFLRLLPSLRQPSFGNALGVDRLHLLVTDRREIGDILPFSVKKLFFPEDSPPPFSGSQAD
ncbi:MAG TPA: amino acid--tRNA ligase-related protein [Patescibacteria group bacterium]|nr:amino acid--tRNA ligase-related protein [Patescibacteria group bacterium]